MAATERSSKRYFCTEHGFVHPDDEVARTCPDCGAPVTEIGGSG
ncbi:MAG: hypothetical protein ABW033_01790 [Acidimicrobiia bacterium]